MGTDDTWLSQIDFGSLNLSNLECSKVIKIGGVTFFAGTESLS